MNKFYAIECKKRTFQPLIFPLVLNKSGSLKLLKLLTAKKVKQGYYPGDPYVRVAFVFRMPN